MRFGFGLKRVIRWMKMLLKRLVVFLFWLLSVMKVVGLIISCGVVLVVKVIRVVWFFFCFWKMI